MRQLASLAIKSGWRLLGLLPLPVNRLLLRLGGEIFYRRNGAGVRRLRANLAHVVPPERVAETTRLAVLSYARQWAEVFSMSRTGRPLLEQVDVTGVDLLRRGRAVVVAVPHMANWDLGGAWVSAHIGPVLAVVEQVRPRAVFEEFVAQRRRNGIEVIDLRSDGSVLPVLQAHLEEDGVVGIIADRDLSRHSVEVRFFGGSARFPVGPAVLAERTGAALVAATLCYRGPRMQVDFVAVPPGSVTERTQALADIFAAGIAAAPADWHMLQRVFVT